MNDNSDSRHFTYSIACLYDNDDDDDDRHIMCNIHANIIFTVKVKASHTRYRALGPELIPMYRQSARR